MTTTLPPAHSKIATPKTEVATLEDVWRESDRTRVPSCAILSAMKELVIGDSKNICNGH